MLRFLGDGEHSDPHERLHAFRLFLLLHLTFRLLFAGIDREEVGWFPAAGLMAACLVLGRWPRFGRIATGVALAVLLAKVFFLYPMWYAFSNHAFIEIACVAALTFWDPSSGEERDLLMRSLRAFTVLVFFYTGLQKVLYGTYFDGAYLAYRASVDATFESVFQFVIPAEELDRLVSYEGKVGDGPYRVDGWLLPVVSNLTWITELGLAASLAVPRLRRAAVWGTLLFLVAIEIAARELEFGALFANLTLLFLPAAWNRRLLPVFAGMYVVILLMKLGWIPEFQVT